MNGETKARRAPAGRLRLVVGLGNPGEEYAHTRHNAGFDAVDLLASELRATYWKSECGARVAHVTFHGEELLLAKPMSFMNTSGGPVSQILRAYRIAADEMVVIHDDLDIEPARIRLKFGGGLAGHNGLKSIAEKTGTRDWYRVRVGIGRPPGRMPVVNWVLSRPKGEQAEDFEQGCTLASEAVVVLATEGLQAAQAAFN